MSSVRVRVFVSSSQASDQLPIPTLPLSLPPKKGIISDWPFNTQALPPGGADIITTGLSCQTFMFICMSLDLI